MFQIYCVVAQNRVTLDRFPEVKFWKIQLTQELFKKVTYPV